MLANRYSVRSTDQKPAHVITRFTNCPSEIGNPIHPRRIFSFGFISTIPVRLGNNRFFSIANVRLSPIVIHTKKYIFEHILPITKPSTERHINIFFPITRLIEFTECNFQIGDAISQFAE
jgi:hypothetical protein